MYRLMRVNAANRNGLARFYFVLGLYTYLMLTITCSPSTAYETLQGKAQGSTYTLQFELSKTTETQLLQKEVDQLLSNIDQSMSTYVPGSIISKLNQSEGAWVNVDALFMRVLVSALEVAKETEGAFDPTIGSVVQLWGFGFDEMRGDISDKSIQEALLRSGFEQINVDTLESSVRIPNGFSIDFNAIAQGFSVDTLALLLELKGIQNYMVELGGEVRTGGYNAQGDHWNIGIDRPINESATGRELQAIISLKNKSLATSGNYRKYKINAETGKRSVHSINPKTGNSFPTEVLSASVLAPTCMFADAFATALMVMPFEEGKALIENEADLEAYWIIEDEKGKTKEVFSSGFSLE